MKLKEHLKSSSQKLLIVDVQEHDYKKFIKFDMHDFAKFVNGYKDVLCLFNGDNLGWESKDQMKEWYNEFDINLSKVKFYEKEYGYFRDLMNKYDEDQIVKLIKLMVQKNITDVRDLDDGEAQKIFGKDFDPDDYPAWVNIDLYNKLKAFGNNIDVCGGGRNECLEEIEYYLKAMGIKYNLINKFIY